MAIEGAALKALLAVATVTSAVTSVRAGKARKQEARTQAAINRADASSREVERKKKLLATLAANNNEAGGGSADPTVGSIANIGARNRADTAFVSANDNSITAANNARLRRRGSNAQRQGLVQGLTTFASGANAISQAS